MTLVTLNYLDLPLNTNEGSNIFLFEDFWSSALNVLIYCSQWAFGGLRSPISSDLDGRILNTARRLLNKSPLYSSSSSSMTPSPKRIRDKRFSAALVKKC
jgi:hypothetical protein